MINSHFGKDECADHAFSLLRSLPNSLITRTSDQKVGPMHRTKNDNRIDDCVQRIYFCILGLKGKGTGWTQTVSGKRENASIRAPHKVLFQYWIESNM